MAILKEGHSRETSHSKTISKVSVRWTEVFGEQQELDTVTRSAALQAQLPGYEEFLQKKPPERVDCFDCL